MENSNENSTEAVKEYEVLDATPTWVAPLFEKMKAEICAEVTAKVAYSVKLMLNNLRTELKEEILILKSSLAAGHQNIAVATSSTEACPCVDPRKCRACKDKRAAIRASHHTFKKEEKRLAKLAYKETKKLRKKCLISSDTDSETEIKQVLMHFGPPIAPTYKLMGPPTSERKLCAEDELHFASSRAQQQAPSAMSESSRHTSATSQHEAKILNDSFCSSLNVLDGNMAREIDLADKPSTKDLTNGASAAVASRETPPLPSDSEFEVVSLPNNIEPIGEYVRVLEEKSHLTVSDYGNSSSEESETETEIEFKDCKPMGNELPQYGGTLYPELELRKLTLSMASSASTVMDDFNSLSSNEVSGGNDTELVGAVGGPLERDRAPYSCTSETVDQINEVEVVHTQPLPSEFLRDRTPYRQIPVAEPVVEQAPTPQPQGQPEQLSKETAPKPVQQRQSFDSSYRVDNLPESLWDEALTVAAQTYNAAKVAVGNLADTFVPGVDRAPTCPVRRTGPPRPVSAASTTMPTRAGPPLSTAGMTPEESILFEMGFTNRELNSTLLARHDRDIQKVIAYLLEL